jgi:hypothetical protein
MKFDVYGQFRLEVIREGDTWIAYQLTPGKRVRMHEIGVPAILAPPEIATFLDDPYHEKSRTGQIVQAL